MTRHIDGEYIHLVWDGAPDAHYIKGHVPNDKGLVILKEEGIIGPDDKPVGVAFHIYGRWSIEPGPDGCTHILREYTSPGRGRFKITVFNVGIFAANVVVERVK